MFEVKNGMIEIKGDAEHIFTRMTPQEWESMMLDLLDKRHSAIQQKLAVKANHASKFPSRPAEMSIWQYVEWKQACDKVNALNCQIDARIQLAGVIVRNCEKSIVEAMPENVKLVIHDAALEAYSVWWTRRYDSEGCRVNDLRIEILSPRPDTSADELPVVPMSQQLSPDLPDEEEDLDPDTERWTDDDVRAIFDDPATKSDNAFGYDDEPPAPATVDDIPF